jgi:hypothetical protein
MSLSRPTGSRPLRRRKHLARRDRFRATFESLEPRRVLDANYFDLSTGNFSQDWSNPDLLTTNHDWSKVPSIEGYQGDFVPNLPQPTDPQTLLDDDANPQLHVLVNQTSPNTLTDGGTAEFALPNPVVALNPSGTADAPYLKIYINTTGRKDITLSFVARDLDASSGDVVQQLAVHYRVGETGPWKNLPEAYVPDASSGPFLAELVTSVSVTLPTETENQPKVQLRIMTTNAPGADEWIGIDDIFITSLPAITENTHPTISDIPNVSTRNFEPTAAIPFTVGDNETPPEALIVTATSNNQALVPDANIVIQGAGANRTITVRPGPETGPDNGPITSPATGTATITVRVQDAEGAFVTDTFDVTVTQAPTLDIGSASGNPGDEVLIPIRLSTNGPVTNWPPIQGIDIVLTYDTNVLQLPPNSPPAPGPGPAAIGLDLVTSYPGNWSVLGNSDDPGKLAISLSATTPLIESFDGVIAYIFATIKPTAPLGSSTINMVKTLVVGGLERATFINEDHPALLLGPTPTAGLDPIADGFVFVRGGAPPENNIPQIPVLGTEDTPVAFTGMFALSVSDPNDTDTLTTTLSVPNASVGTFTANNGGGSATVTGNGTTTLTIEGPPEQVNLALATVLFVPAPNRNTPADGPTIVTMVTTNGTTTSATDTITVFLSETNDPPVGTPDPLPSIVEDSGPLAIPIATLLANDDPGAPNESSQIITFTGIAANPAPVGGTVTVGGPNVIFTPTPGYFGPASFSYTIADDGTNGGMPAPLPGEGSVSFVIQAVNDPPSFVKGPDQSVPYNSPAQNIPNWATAISTGAANEVQTLTFLVSNDNNSLFTAEGQPAISPTGTLTFTPAPGASGSATVTVTLKDDGGTENGGVDTSEPQTFVITVTSPGNAPTIDAIPDPPAILEDALLQTIQLTGISDGGDPQQQGITITASSSNPTVVPHPTVNYTSPQTTGSLTFTPVPDAHGTALITVTVRDAGLDLIPGNDDDLTTTRSFTVNVLPVNDRPTFTAVNPPAVDEDAGPVSVPGFVTEFNPGPANESTQTVLNYTVSNISDPSLFAVAPFVAPDGTLTYTPAPHANGTATFDLTVTDNGGSDNGGTPTSTVQTFTIAVNAVNDAPTIAIGGNQQVPNGAPAQTVEGFASLVSVGPPNEAGQTLIGYVVTNDNASLFSVQPAISPSGILTYTPAPGQGGTATVTVRGQDSGGTANGGVDLSAPLTFTITVDGPIVNSPPTLAPLNDLFINEDAGLQTVNLTGISGGTDAPPQSVTVTASTDNPTLIPDLTVNYTSPSSTGSLSFTPAPNANGSATITVTIRDSGLNLIPNDVDDLIVTRTFTVHVNAVNDQPSFTAVNPPAVNEDSGPQTVPNFITSFHPGGGADEAGQTPTYNVASVSNPSLFAVLPTVTPAGQLSYTLAPDAYGSSTFQVTVTDNGGTANGGVATSAPQTFTITVHSVNDPPSFVIGPNRTTPNTAGPQSLPGQATSISPGPANEAGQTVTFLVANNNSSLFLVQPAISSSGTLTYTPAPGASGTATVSVTAQDNGGTENGGNNTSAPQTFTITIANNNPPTIDPIGSYVINENSGLHTVDLTGITTGGEIQFLSVTASSSNPTLIPTPTVNYTSPNSTGVLTFAPVFQQVGQATITVTVRDSGFDGLLNTPDDAITATSFTVQVNEVNDPPVAHNQTVPAVLNTPVNGTLTATDPDGPSLSYSLLMLPVLGDVTLDPVTGAFTYTPHQDATGLDVFTFQVTDGEFFAEGTVRVAIQGMQPVVTGDNGDLLVIGTPEPDVILVSPMGAGIARVRTNLTTVDLPLTNSLVINSGEGDDYVVVTNIMVPTTIDLSGGDDYVSSGLQDDLIIGGAGNDRINASGGNNVIWGDAIYEQDLPTGGDDVLSSLGGNDIIYGGGGNDEIYAGAGDDYVHAGHGDDLVSGGEGNDRIYGSGGADRLYGDAGDDVIVGGDGGDVLAGRSGDDILIGGAGADTLNGYEGRDLLFGSDLKDSASSAFHDAADLALLALLAAWRASHPAGLVSSLSTGDDGSPDELSGYTEDDDFYVGSGDKTPDLNRAHMGTDRLFTL